MNSLAGFIRHNNAQERVRLLRCDVLDTPLKPDVFSGILSIGVLYYLDKDYERGKKHLISLLERGGIFIESEPDLEGQALKALLFDEIDIFANMIKSHKFVEVYDGRSYNLRLFDRGEIKNSFETVGMEIIDWKGVSLLPLLFVIARSRGLLNEDKISKLESAIENTFDYFNEKGNIYKHIIWLARKL